MRRQDYIVRCEFRTDLKARTITLIDRSPYEVMYKDIVMSFIEKDAGEYASNLYGLSLLPKDTFTLNYPFRFEVSKLVLKSLISELEKLRDYGKVVAGQGLSVAESSVRVVEADDVSDFVAMKIVSRFKELRKADPGKAATGGLDLTWAKELYQAGKQAELLEGNEDVGEG